MNIKVVTSHIAHAYGINVMNPGQLQPLGIVSRATLDAAFTAVDDFRAACGGRLNLLINFLRGLDQGGNAAAKLLAMKQINAAFGCQISVLPNPPVIARWTALGASCGAAALIDRPHLRSFYTVIQSVIRMNLEIHASPRPSPRQGPPSTADRQR
jgi:hypothetical protein